MTKVSPEQKPSEPRLPQLLQQAVTAHQAGDLDSAAPLYRRFLAQHPDHPTALQLLGLLHSQRGEYGPAIEYMQESLRRFPRQAEVANNLGNALSVSGRQEEALENYRRAVELAPRYSDAWRNLGVCYLERQQFREADEAFRRCLEIWPEDAAAWLGVGNVFKSLQHYDQSLECYEQALALRPGYAEAQHNIGICLRMKQSAADTVSDYNRACQLHADGRLVEAEQAYRVLAQSAGHRETVLRALTELYLETRRPQEAIDTLVALTETVPDQLYYYARLAALLEGMGHVDAAISHYHRLLQRRPEYAAAHFNLALLYRNDKRYPQALEAYSAAINHGIDNVQEVWTNMGVVYSEMRQGGKAREMYERALEIDPEYIPALFNLAGLYEEMGERQHAVDLYKRILDLNPRYWDALARLASVKNVSNGEVGLIETLKRATEEARDDPMGREGLLFALGKVLDDLERYEEAFTSYRTANELGRIRNPAYDAKTAEQAFTRLMELYSPEWIRHIATTSTATPVFICGMFRSGSTLVEQILANHPSITAGGELDYLPLLMARRLAPFPERLQDVSVKEMEALGNEYLSKLSSLFPEANIITDKRPDNFLNIGLIKILFPAARIIYTKRNPMDNCLSIYFQQLGGNLSYATDLENIAHYYRQHLRLMAHWTDCFGEDIFTVDYDKLVRTPEPVLRSMLNFLGLEWDDRCLSFQGTDNLVKTASVWQVREELHTHSSGRWRNYAPCTPDMQALLDVEESMKP